MKAKVVKKIRQVARRKEREELDKEMRILPLIFNPRLKLIPKFIWKFLFHIIVRKDMIKYNE